MNNTNIIISDLSKNNDWNKENENIVIEWIDVAFCYKWLSHVCSENYIFYNNCYSIPIIIVSTVTGSTLISSYNNGNSYFFLVTGILNIFVGILSSLKIYYNVPELKENYKNSYITWLDIENSLNLEISRNSNERVNASQFINTYKVIIENSINKTPFINDIIITKYKNMIIKKKGDFFMKYADESLDDFNKIISLHKYNV
jgi:hypothetical protein